MNLPFGVIQESIPRVGYNKIQNNIESYVKIWPLAKLIIRNKKKDESLITTMTVELQVGTLLSDFYKKQTRYRYYVDNKKRVRVSYNIVSETRLEWQLSEYIKECNTVKLLYCI